jgi:short-subunit dehydrogenase
VAAAAAACRDVTLLVNNAGIMRETSLFAPAGLASLREELEVNALGLAAMIRAFAPVLGANGGGAMANMLSVVSWYVYPFNATYCASKAAALAVSDAARFELKAQGTLVVGVYAGFIDTDMAARVEGRKTPPEQVAERTLAGIREGQHHVYADAFTEETRRVLRQDPEGWAGSMQREWDEGRGWRS